MWVVRRPKKRDGEPQTVLSTRRSGTVFDQLCELLLPGQPAGGPHCARARPGFRGPRPQVFWVDRSECYASAAVRSADGLPTLPEHDLPGWGSDWFSMVPLLVVTACLLMAVNLGYEYIVAVAQPSEPTRGTRRRR